MAFARSEVVSKDDRPGDERLSTNDQHWFPVTNVHNSKTYYFCHNVGNTFSWSQTVRKKSENAASRHRDFDLPARGLIQPQALLLCAAQPR